MGVLSHLRRPRGDLWIRRARRPRSRPCRDHPQEPGVRVSRRDHPGPHAALSHAATQPTLHGRHPRQAPRRSGRPEEGGRHRGPERFEPATLVEARGVASYWRARSLNIRLDETTRPVSVGTRNRAAVLSAHVCNETSRADAPRPHDSEMTRSLEFADGLSAPLLITLGPAQLDGANGRESATYEKRL